MVPLLFAGQQGRWGRHITPHLDRNCTGSMKENGKPTSLKDLDERLKAAHGRRAEKSGTPQGRGDVSGFAVGLRIVVDLVAGIAVGVGIGLVLDNWLGTQPWLLIVFVFVGFAAGLLNVIRTAKQLEMRAARQKAEGGAGGDNKAGDSDD